MLTTSPSLLPGKTETTWWFERCLPDALKVRGALHLVASLTTFLCPSKYRQLWVQCPNNHSQLSGKSCNTSRNIAHCYLLCRISEDSNEMNYLLFSYIVCIQKSTNIRVQEFICFERLLFIAAARNRSHNSTWKSFVDRDQQNCSIQVRTIYSWNRTGGKNRARSFGRYNVSSRILKNGYHRASCIRIRHCGIKLRPNTT